MNKVEILEKILILILIIIILIGFSNLVATARIIANPPTEYAYTKAICNSSNYCEDYFIKCDKRKLISLTPTGQTIQKSEDWIDERRDKSEFCN